jgi:undecaprenyl-diphosphatase
MLAGALSVFAVVTVDVLLGGPLTALDGVLSRWVRTTGLPGLGWRRPGQRELDQLVNFGDREVVATVLVVVLAVVCWQARTLLPLLRLVVVAALTIGTVWGLKVAIARPAPSGVTFEDALRSYPSGHTATAVVLWGLLAAVVADYRPRSVSAPVVEVLSWLGPLLTMTGLLLRDYHWLSDLIAGTAVGVVLVQVERLALRHWLGARRGSRPVDQPTAVPRSRPAGAIAPPGAARDNGSAGRLDGAAAGRRAVGFDGSAGRLDGPAAGRRAVGFDGSAGRLDGASPTAARPDGATDGELDGAAPGTGPGGAGPAHNVPAPGRTDTRLSGS